MKLLLSSIKHLSIKRKLILLSMITSSIAVFITCSAFVLFDVMEERNDMIEEISLVGEILAEEISSAVGYKERDVVNESLYALNVRETIIQACVIDAAGEEFARFDKGKPFDCKKVPKHGKKYAFIDNGILDKYLIVATDIKFDHIKRGTLYIFSSLQKINDKVVRAFYHSVVLFIIIIGISYVISRNLQKNISNPILQLADVSYAVKSGDYDIRAKYFSNDELGELTSAFNNMLNVIQDSKINLEKKVRKRTQDLEKAMQVKSDFLSNMSHEIRTPIHGIMNYADFLVHDWDKLDEAKRFEFIKKLYANSDRLMSLINNLLDLSKLDANKMEFNFSQNDLAELIKDCIEEVEPLYIAKNIQLVFEGYEKSKFISAFDRERILQVVRNILSNAIKFTKNGTITTKIAFTTYKIKEEIINGIIVSIIDDGIGIPEKELKYIFDKFSQSAHTKTGAGGTGLGLAICRDIIKAHKGLVWAENNLDKAGAKFSFIIPIMQNHKKKEIITKV